MLADQRLREGKLDESLAQLQEHVRKDPSNSKYRVFLFQLLSVLGQWERALTQLKVVGEMDSATLPMVQAYREAVQCEVLRAGVFAGTRSPLVFGEPEEWVALLIEALRVSAGGAEAEAQTLRGRAFEAAPLTSGALDGERFEWIADADSRLGPILEVIVNGRYYWAPFHRIRKILLEEPADLRDVVWTPAQFVWANGGQTVGMIPTRYAGTEGSDDSQLRLARKTEWLQRGDDVYVGLGQRMLVTDAAERPLMDVRSIELDTAEGPDDAGAGAAGA